MCNVHWFTSQLTDMQEWSISDVSSPNELGKERSHISYQILSFIFVGLPKKNKNSNETLCFSFLWRCVNLM